MAFWKIEGYIFDDTNIKLCHTNGTGEFIFHFGENVKFVSRSNEAKSLYELLEKKCRSLSLENSSTEESDTPQMGDFVVGGSSKWRPE